jgi:hypothetical protein
VPALGDGVLDKGRTLAAKLVERGKAAVALYETGIRGRVGAADGWEKKVRDAKAQLDDVEREWGAFEKSLPSNEDNTTADVAAHYFDTERTAVAEYTGLWWRRQ